MSVTQIVDIPASRRITLDVPPQIPTGPVILTFTPAQRTDTPCYKPISQYFNILSPDTYGDGAAYQRKLREEWDD